MPATCPSWSDRVTIPASRPCHGQVRTQRAHPRELLRRLQVAAPLHVVGARPPRRTGLGRSGPTRIRTGNRLLAKQLLYRWSYRPMWWSGGGCPPGMHPPGGQPLRPVCKTRSAGPGPTAHRCTRQRLRPRKQGGLARRSWWRGWDLNPRPPAYEAGELPDCSTPRRPSGGTAPGDEHERRRDCGSTRDHLPPPVGALACTN